MVYYVTGSNLFGQWPHDNLIINKFHTITENNLLPGISAKMPNMLQINWSYNLIQIDKDFYLSGSWNGENNKFIKIPLPSDNSFLNNDITMVGNDKNYIIIGNNINTLWVGDFKFENGMKKININIEAPVSSAKKLKKDIKITKAVLFNESCLYLTSLNILYNGILPSNVDVEHCKGKICDIQCGYEHFMLLTDIGAVYTWGNGRRLQLGHGDIRNIDIPTQVEALAGIKVIKISSGGWHSLALSEFGDLYAWGWNDIGQLGIKENNGSCESYSEPTLVELFDSDGIEVTMNVIDIACGSRHSAILLEDKSVWTTGFNKYGQLGFSEVEFPSTSCFKKAFKCDNDCKLLCGPWTTVIISN